MSLLAGVVQGCVDLAGIAVVSLGGVWWTGGHWRSWRGESEREGGKEGERIKHMCISESQHYSSTVDIYLHALIHTC